MATAQQENENSADGAKMLKTLQKCIHCGEETGKGNKYCNSCTYAKERLEMCQENKRIMPSYTCKTCEI